MDSTHRLCVALHAPRLAAMGGGLLVGGIRKSEPDGACKVVWEDVDGERREEVLEKINVYASRWLEFRPRKLGEKTRHLQKFYS